MRTFDVRSDQVASSFFSKLSITEGTLINRWSSPISMNQKRVMKYLGVLPWVRREPGQEAQANILRVKNQGTMLLPGFVRADASAGQIKGQEPLGFHPVKVDQSQNLPQKPRKVNPLRTHSHRSADVAVPGLKVTSKQHADDLKHDQAILENKATSLSLIYAQIHDKLWLVAECEEWDHQSQDTFKKLLSACFGLIQAEHEPELHWFSWPLKIAAPIENNHKNMTQAVRGWVHGKGQAQALWISLGRRFVDILLDSTLPSGQVFVGQSAMKLVWFEPLPALQVEPSLKMKLWQFVRAQLAKTPEQNTE